MRHYPETAASRRRTAVARVRRRRRTGSGEAAAAGGFAATSAHLCETAPPVVVTAAGAEGHQDGDAPQSCDASGYGPRQLADLSHPPAVSGTTPGAPAASSPGNVSPAVTSASAPGSPFGSVVLRC